LGKIGGSGKRFNCNIGIIGDNWSDGFSEDVV